MSPRAAKRRSLSLARRLLPLALLALVAPAAASASVPARPDLASQNLSASLADAGGLASLAPREESDFRLFAGFSLLPKTRVRGFEVPAGPRVGEESGLTPRARPGWDEPCREIASGIRLGLDLDTDLGWYYARNRWYDPETGSFASSDPLGYPDSANAYVWGVGGPWSGDPMGLAVSTTKKGIVISDERQDGQWYVVPWDLAYQNPASTVELLRRGGLRGAPLDEFLDKNHFSAPSGEEYARAVAIMFREESARSARFAARTGVAIAEAEGFGRGAAFVGKKVASLVLRRAASAEAGQALRFLARDIGDLGGVPAPGGPGSQPLRSVGAAARGPNVAVGKGGGLSDFAEGVGAKSYHEWLQSGLVNEPVSRTNFGFPFYRATNRAGRIMFNLEGVDIQAARGLEPRLARSIDPIRHSEIGGRGLITEWELRQILQNERLFESTDFYWGANVKFTPQEAASMGVAPIKP